MLEIYIIGGILALVLQILIIVKFFQMASSLNALKRHFVPTVNQIMKKPTEEIKSAYGAKGVTYSIVDDVVTFSDGKIGEIMFSQDQNKWSFKTENYISDRQYIDVYYATEALYDYLTMNQSPIIKTQ